MLDGKVSDFVNWLSVDFTLLSLDLNFDVLRNFFSDMLKI